ncbi:flavin monoamine oxidase family protein [Actinomadura madurae]|uniref:flavin monoamine oxidase family protein n=1 Tax=Actinomadura madurae TaxID=1993 RepID=UPI0027E398C7|nr:FAD-dependent oxidoreductase [Actinomadura madurae]
MDDLSRDETADVAVVGAGLAGLVAARDLRRAGLRPLVIEARDRVGGRTWTRPAPGGAVEAGGQFTGPTQDRLAALAGDLGVATFATYHVGRTRIDLAGGRLAYKRAKRLLAELERMASELPPDAPWTAAHAVEWDAPTFEDWLRGSGGAGCARRHAHADHGGLRGRAGPSCRCCTSWPTSARPVRWTC